MDITHRPDLDALCANQDMIERKIRRQFRSDEAQDLAQSFVLWVLRTGAIARYDPERGSWNTFVDMLLRRFLGQERRRRGRLKRGGRHRIVPLDDPSATALSTTRRPDASLEHRGLVDEVVAAVRTEHERLAPRGREWCVDLFLQHDLVPVAERPSYVELAARHRADVTAVRNALFGMRDAVRRRVRRRLAQ